jgi:carbohydrate diacid regulator
MHLSPKLASKIISEVQEVVKEDIILVDINGIIISSTDKSRIGSFHEGATIVIKSKQKLYIDQAKAKVLKGVKAGINMPIMFNKQVIGVIGITGEPKQVEPYAELIRRMTELIIQEAYYTERNEWEIRGIESYLYEWINATSVDKDFLERGVMLGIPVYEAHICTLMELEIQTLNNDDIHRIQKEIIQLFYTIFGKEKHFIVRWGQERFLILKKMDDSYKQNYFHSQLKNFKNRFESRYESSLAIGVGKTVCKHVINKSFKEAQKALKVAQKNNDIVFYDDLILEIILEDIPAEIQKDFLKRTIDLMKEDKILIETLQHYINNNQSIKRTAEEMNIHINTLHYRLNKIEELTGINPKTTEGIVIFYIALMLLNSLNK